MARGFTLIETISVIIVLATLGSLASFLLVDATDAYSRVATSAQLHTELSIALDRIDRELRNIDQKTGASTVAPNITSFSSTAITFNTNSSLSLSGSSLQLVINGGTARTLLTDVTAFTLDAYNESNAAVTLPVTNSACDVIRRVQVSITLQRSGVTARLRTKLYLRCTMEGAEA